MENTDPGDAPRLHRLRYDAALAVLRRLSLAELTYLRLYGLRSILAEVAARESDERPLTPFGDEHEHGGS